jgi:hypothetical protein
MITREFTLGDRLTSLLAKLYSPGGSPVVLGVAETVAFRMILTSSGAVKVADAACTIVSRGSTATNTPAQVRYDWAAADVNTAGEYTAWFIRTSAGETEHFPPQDPDSPEFQVIIRART